MANNLAPSHPVLVGVLVIVNGLTAFSVTREFSLVFGGKPKPMTVRSPEVLWPMILPTVIVMGFALHVPLILKQYNLLPAWGEINLILAGLLTVSTLVGISLAAYIYLNESISKPIQLKPKAVQDFFAYDLYTAQFYKNTIVLAVGLVSGVISWFDRFIIDGVVNLVGLVTLFSGQSLKYNVSGQTQFYVFSILVGTTLLGIIISWPLLSQISLVFGQ
jgi:NAD(P)H-quinone oxidoreductase subunit 5